jgi:single-strand DNA-binding protein
MNQLNSILIEGNLTRDPEFTTTKSDKAVCNFSIANNRSYKKNDKQEKEVSFFDVEVWNGLADTCRTYLKKGRGVRIVGRLKQNRWVNSESGDNMQNTKIVAEHVEFKPLFSS